MEEFYLDVKDPMFGLIILISIILLVSILSYIWGVFNKKNEHKNVENFIKKFENSDFLSDEHKELLNKLEISTETLGILASVFVKNGDFERAIGIYLIALNKAKKIDEKEFILTNLGKVYFKAGFLARAENVFLQTLHLKPRNKDALMHLNVIYEKLKRYDKALEVIDVLMEQGKDAFSEREYINALRIANDTKITFKDKIDKILNLKFKGARRFAFELFLQNKEPLNTLKIFPKADEILDLLFNLDESVNLDDNEYKAVFYAKGLIPNEAKSKFFEINAIAAMRKSGFNAGDLNFTYTCSKCKSQVPLFFYRCPVCYELDTILPHPNLTEKNFEISQTF